MEFVGLLLIIGGCALLGDVPFLKFLPALVLIVFGTVFTVLVRLNVPN